MDSEFRIGERHDLGSRVTVSVPCACMLAWMHTLLYCEIEYSRPLHMWTLALNRKHEAHILLSFIYEIRKRTAGGHSGS